MRANGQANGQMYYQATSKRLLLWLLWLLWAPGRPVFQERRKETQKQLPTAPQQASAPRQRERYCARRLLFTEM